MTREEAIKVINEHFPSTSCGEYKELIEALDMAIEALSAEKPIVKNYDLISRADAIKAFDGNSLITGGRNAKEFKDYVYGVIDKIKKLPSADRPSGVWVESEISNEKWVCSNCGGACWYYDYTGELGKSNFCPNCGADMRGTDK